MNPGSAPNSGFISPVFGDIAAKTKLASTKRSCFSGHPRAPIIVDRATGSIRTPYLTSEIPYGAPSG